MKRIALAALTAASLAAAVIATTPPREGCGAACCHRPTPEADCKRRHPLTGEVLDHGDATMPGSHAVGSGCEPTECVVGQGIEWLDGGSK